MPAECRLCRSDRTEVVLQIEGTPVHQNVAAATQAEALACPTGDIALTFCTSCGFAFNARFDAAGVRYSPPYESGQDHSPLFRSYLDALAGELAGRYDLTGKRVVEIGCGQGAFLVRLVAAAGCFGVGFDPSFDPARGACHDRTTFIQAGYDPGHPRAAGVAVCARHVIEHLPGPAELIEGIRRSARSSPATLWLETPRLEWIVERRAFWDIFYEHCSYFSMPALAGFLRRLGWRIVNHREVFDRQYQWIEAQIPMTVGPRFDAHDQDTHVAQMRARLRELAAGWTEWRAGWRASLAALAARGPCVIWGAGAKGVSFLNHLGAARDIVSAVVDINPHKLDRYVPGTGQRIVPPQALRDLRAATIIVMNSSYLAEIHGMLRHHAYKCDVIALDEGWIPGLPSESREP